MPAQHFQHPAPRHQLESHSQYATACAYKNPPAKRNYLMQMKCGSNPCGVTVHGQCYGARAAYFAISWQRRSAMFVGADTSNSSSAHVAVAWHTRSDEVPGALASNSPSLQEVMRQQPRSVSLPGGVHSHSAAEAPPPTNTLPTGMHFVSAVHVWSFVGVAWVLMNSSTCPTH